MTSKENFDAVIIGSGINSLVAAAVLSKSGWRVLVCERNATAGGAIHTSQATLPGFTYELLSSWHPLFVGGPAYTELKDDLAKHGLIYKNTELPTGVVCKSGTAILSTNPEVTALEFSKHGDIDDFIATAPEAADNDVRRTVHEQSGGHVPQEDAVLHHEIHPAA